MLPGMEATPDTMAEPAEDPDPHRSLSLDIVTEAGDWDSLGDNHVLLAPLTAAISAHPLLREHFPAQACIALSDDATVRRLNKQFRNQDKPTNVLSFPAHAEHGAPDEDSRSLGDIIVAFETVASEATEQHLRVADHLTHLVLHGVLHLIGYDHEAQAEAEAMEALEIELLAAIGIANPYAEAVA